MSIDSRLKRASAVAVGLAMVGPSVQPDSSIDSTDRVVIAYNYAVEIAAIAPPAADVPEITGRIPVQQSVVGIVPSARSILVHARSVQRSIEGTI